MVDPAVSSAAGRQPHPWWVGVVSGMASYIDAAAIISFGIAIVIYQTALGLDKAAVGVVSGVLTFGIAIGALVGGKLGDLFGRRVVFTITMILVAVGATSAMLASSYAALFVGTLLIGLGTGADLPVSLSTISEAANDENRGKLLGFSQVLWSVGIAVAIILGTVVGNRGLLGGRILFGHIAGIAVLVLIARLTIPESEVWRAAHAERAQGSRTVRATRASVLDLLKAPYLTPFVALLVFYTLINLAANTAGQFTVYLLVNVAGVSVSTASQIMMYTLPLGLLMAFWFVRIVDGPRRFTYFKIGAILDIVAQLVPAFFGFTIVTYLISAVLGIVGASFAGEAIFKYWTQESFPTLLRTTAQGTSIAVARLSAALLAGVTPLIAAISPNVLYGFLTAVVAIGMIVAWAVFQRRDRHSEFTTEQLLVEAPAEPSVRPSPAASSSPV